MRNQKTRMLIETALCAAIALILDVAIPSLGFGLKISVKMLPIIILSLRWGVVAGFTGGLLWGLLQMIVGDAYILSPIQVVLEYFLAFAFIGFAGFVHKAFQGALRNPESPNKPMVLASVGLLIGSFARYLIHFIAGVVFWGEYAPEGMSPVVNSIIVNGGAFLSETITCLVVLVILVKLYRRLFIVTGQ